MGTKKEEKSDINEQAVKKEKANKIDTIETHTKYSEWKAYNGTHSNRWVIFFDCLLTTNDKTQAKFNENTSNTAFAYYIFRVDEKKYGCDARYTKHFKNLYFKSVENRYVACYFDERIKYFTGQWQKNGQNVFETEIVDKIYHSM